MATAPQPAPTPVPTAVELSISFAPDSADIPADSQAALDRLAEKMVADPNMRVQVMASASGTEETESKARRMSLSRGIQVRNYLYHKGVRSTRIDVRALGLKGGGADRVDIVPAESLQ
jgi:outer membrane protein OmpA-like peptidoglycan-associated protein